MNFIFKTLIAIVLFTGSALFAAPADNSFAQNEHTGQLVVGSYTPVPDEKILERWSLDFHEAMPETWVLTNFTLSEFVKIFMDGQASEELKQEIDKSISINLSLEQSLKLFSFINNPLLPQPGLQYSFVQLTPELKAKIPEPILSKVYQLLYKTGMSPRFQRFPTRDAMLKYYREQETTAQSLEIIEKNIFEINGELMVYIWPHV
ncbi:MAG TPA: hypothetical protein VN132_00310, partial [Bdellovibrio sp.]|nr:hypothetical protein [Bdellovibrio sp.]